MSIHKNPDGTYTRDGLAEIAKAHLLFREKLPALEWAAIGGRK
jgi:hypothetical protein